MLSGIAFESAHGGSLATLHRSMFKCISPLVTGEEKLPRKVCNSRKLTLLFKDLLEQQRLQCV